VLCCVLFQNENQPTPVRGVHGWSFLLERLSVILLEAQCNFPVCGGFDVIPVRGSRGNGCSPKSCSGIIELEVAKRRLTVILDRDVDSVRAAAGQDSAEKSEQDADGQFRL